MINATVTGIKFALATGNESDDGNNHSPARANHENNYTVTAMEVKIILLISPIMEIRQSDSVHQVLIFTQPGSENIVPLA